MKPALRIFMILAVCSLLLTSLAACQPANQPQTQPTTPPALDTTEPPTPAPPAVTATPSPDEIRRLVAAALIQLALQPNRMDSTTVLADGTSSSNVIEYIPPDNKHITSLEEEVEYIVTGGMVYAKTSAGGAWETTDIPAVSFLGDTQSTEDSLAATISDAKILRADVYEGIDVVVFSYTSATTTNGVELHSQTELWVGVDDGLPYKMIIDGEVLAASLDPATGESKLSAAQALTTTTIHFGGGFTIEPPVQ